VVAPCEESQLGRFEWSGPAFAHGAFAVERQAPCSATCRRWARH